MTESTSALTRQGDMPLAQLGQAFATSGYFVDARDAAQAIVKIQAGRELGFGPVASMCGVQIIKGKIGLSSGLMAAAIKRAKPRYDYKIIEHTDQACELVFFETAQEPGRSRFTMEDAATAGLTKGDNWKGYPRNMLFARAMSNGAKWFCPDALNGCIAYTPDELGAIVDGATGEVIDVPAAPSRPVPSRPPAPPVAAAPAPAVPAPAPASLDLSKLKDLIEAHNLTAEVQAKWCQHFKVASLDKLAQEEVNAIVKRVLESIAGKVA